MAALATSESDSLRELRPLVHTTRGPVRGVRTGPGGVSAFRGIPYAVQPVGSRRFLPAADRPRWSGVLEADRHGPACPQPPDPVLHGAGVRRTLGELHAFPPSFPQDERCLTLSVWSPSLDPAARLPVVVYVHGGGFTLKFGCAEGSTVTDGDRLAERGAVVVAVNHRLGVLGFLALEELLGPAYASSGNAGLTDLVAALRWTRREISAFGGDPERVTLFGESGGAMKICALLASPQARGLYARAALHSGALLEALPAADASGVARALLRELGLAPHSAHELLRLPATRLIAAQEALMRRADLPAAGLVAGFAPVLDGLFLREPPFSTRAAQPPPDVPLLVGTTRDELTLFALAADAPLDEATLARGAYEAFRRDAWRLADRRAERGGAVHVFRFDWSSPALDGRLGAAHALDVPFVLQTTSRAPVAAGPVAAGLADRLGAAWLAFAADGVPRLPDGPDWPAHRRGSRAAMLLCEQPVFAPLADAVADERPRRHPSEWLRLSGRVARSESGADD